MSGKKLTRSDLEKQITDKAQKDENFKKLLFKNPKEAIAQIGIDIPEGMEVQVFEEASKITYSVKPNIPEELTDEALDLIAAGCGCNGNAATSCGAASGNASDYGNAPKGGLR